MIGTEDYVLSDLAIVSALGVGCDETRRRLAQADASGMKPIELSNGDHSVFGFAPLRPEAFASAPTRIAALLNAVLDELSPALEKLFQTISPARVGVVIGTSNSTMEEFTDNPDRIDMAYPATYVKAKLNLGGPAFCVSTACSSSAKVFASARRLLEGDLCDAVLVGGADAHTRTVVEGFHSLEALSPTLTRPLSPTRDGINLGEGAALFILHRGLSGIKLLGVGESSDAYHLTAPDPEGRGAEAAMRAALADAQLEPSDISCINLHGTGTVYNDAMETAAVHRVFGPSVCMSSTKPLTGHCLGAAGAIEAALCWLLLSEAHRPMRILSNSFAFGGSNASVILGNEARPPLKGLLPQANRMLLLTDWEPGATADSVTTYVEVSSASMFYEPSLQGVPSCVALEYMAQAMALFVGLQHRARHEPPQVGFVLGTRKLTLTVPCFEAGKRYRIIAKCTYEDMEFGSFDCTILSPEGAVVASATLSAFQPSGELTPDKMKEFT